MIIYALSFNKWNGVQEWMWNQEWNGRFWPAITGATLGIVEYYWLFLFACFSILMLVTAGIAMCYGRSAVGGGQAEQEAGRRQ